MAELKDKAENGLNEARILILAGQVVIGSDLRIFFEDGFEKLTRSSQIVMTIIIGLTFAALGPLMMPAAFHRIVERGVITERLQQVTSLTVGIALLPFALGLGGSIYIVSQRILGNTLAIAAGTLMSLLSIWMWYGLEIVKRKRGSTRLDVWRTLLPKGKIMDAPGHKARSLTEKIKQVLIEDRMVLPGAQALLGFQLICVFARGFEQLPFAAKLLHLASLAAVAICTVLLITPAAYHRIVEEGEDSDSFHAFASNILLWAMVFLALGGAGDFAVTINKVTHSWTLATTLSAGLIVLYFGLWFGYSKWKRHTLQADERRRKVA